MTTATRKTTRVIHNIEEIVRQTIPERLGLIGQDCGLAIAAVRESFRGSLRLADSSFQSLRANLDKWRSNVRCGETEFDQNGEDDFKDALRALIVLADLLYERAEAYQRQNIILRKPWVIGALRDKKREAQRILD